MGRTGSFPVCADWKSRRALGFYPESAKAKTENGNSPANVLGLLGLIAASLVLPLFAVGVLLDCRGHQRDPNPPGAVPREGAALRHTLTPDVNNLAQLRRNVVRDFQPGPGAPKVGFHWHDRQPVSRASCSPGEIPRDSTRGRTVMATFSPTPCVRQTTKPTQVRRKMLFCLEKS
jgi:hypothetical protein